MKQIGVVFGYTFRDAVRKKAFRVSTIIILLLILLLCSLPRIIGAFSDDSSADDAEAVPGSYSGKCYYTEDGVHIEGAEEALRAALPGMEILPIDAEKAESIRETVKEDPDISVISVTEKDGMPLITVTIKDFMSGVSQTAVTETLSSTYLVQLLMENGVTEEMAALSQSSLPTEVDLAGNMNLSGYAIGIVLTLLMFFAIYYYGYGVSMSVATEKTSRVMETLVVSAKPSNILIGKCLAMGALGLCQFSLIIVFAAACWRLLIPADFQLFGMPLSLSAFTLPSALLILLYFILGYSLYAVMNSVCGASVSKIEDVQAAMMPVMLITMVSFYLGYFSSISSSGNGLLQKIAIYIPFSSPFIVPFRLLNGDIPTGDIVISIVALVIAIVLVLMVSIKIYSASVLHYGDRLKLKDWKTLAK